MSRNVESVASKIEQLLAQFSDVETFLNQDGEAFALLSVNSRTHLYPTRSTEFSEALTYLFFQRTNKSPGSTAVADLIGVLNARARFEGKRREVFTRIGKSENTVFIDLARRVQPRY